MELTQTILHELLLYDPYTGSLTWRRRDRRWFKCDRDWKAWNTKNAGKPAFATPDSDGYPQGRIFGKSCRAHRMIWLYMTGHWPDPEIDHKNRNLADNRFQNLREATHRQNSRNKSLRYDSTTRMAGVLPLPSGNYQAQIHGNDGCIRLGTFKTIAEAAAARRAAAAQYGYSPGHGRARLRRKEEALQ